MKKNVEIGEIKYSDKLENWKMIMNMYWIVSVIISKKTAIFLSFTHELNKISKIWITGKIIEDIYTVGF